MNEKEAELIGMHVGDGTLYLSGKTLVWEMRGSIHEQEYYSYVADLIRDNLGIEVKPRYRGPTSYGIQTTNKGVTNFFLSQGFGPGKKVYTVRIPDYIKQGSPELQKAFIRGLFDTDGCIRFDKNRTQYHYYPRIEFNMASKSLMIDLKGLFDKLNFKNYLWRDRNSLGICLAGFKNLDKWIVEIKPANPKHVKRISGGILNKDKIALKKTSKIVKIKDSTNL